MAAGARRGGDTAPGTPGREGPAGKGKLRAALRPGSARHGPGTVPAGSAWRGALKAPRAGGSPGRASFPRDGCAATAAGRVLRGDARPPAGLAPCLALPGGWGSPSSGRNRPVRRAPKQQGQGLRPVARPLRWKFLDTGKQRGPKRAAGFSPSATSCVIEQDTLQ